MLLWVQRPTHCGASVSSKQDNSAVSNHWIPHRRWGHIFSFFFCCCCYWILKQVILDGISDQVGKIVIEDSSWKCKLDNRLSYTTVTVNTAIIRSLLKSDDTRTEDSIIALFWWHWLQQDNLTRQVDTKSDRFEQLRISNLHVKSLTLQITDIADNHQMVSTKNHIPESESNINRREFGSQILLFGLYTCIYTPILWFF